MSAELKWEIIAKPQPYLHVIISGVNTDDSTRDYIEQVGRLADEHRIGKALIDLSGYSLPSTTQEFRAANLIAQVWSARLKAAFFGRSEGQFQFGENVAFNRGARVAGFVTREQALAWLFG